MLCPLKMIVPSRQNHLTCDEECAWLMLIEPVFNKEKSCWETLKYCGAVNFEGKTGLFKNGIVSTVQVEED